MNYEESIEYIHATPKFSRVLGNDVLHKLLGVLGNPHKGLKFIHVAGTNGKGSVCVMIGSILINSGYKTGMFTSPYIERYNERIQINNEEIPDNELAELITEVREAMEKSGFFVSEFALGAAVAFLYFERKKCDFVVLEVGMGGLLDATNVIEESIVSIIGLIGLDHTMYLGDTIEKIAREKCGIIKDNADVVTYPLQKEDAMSVIRDTCREKNANLIMPDMPEITDGGFIYKNERYKLSLMGVYQPYNAVMAIEAVNVIKNKGYNTGNIPNALMEVKWPVRCEKVWDRPPIIIDGAHNIDGINGLCETLKGLGRKVYIISAMMRDKAYKECIEKISSLADRFYAVRIDYPRCAEAEDIAKYSVCGKTYIYHDFAQALKDAADESEDNIICICGSLFLAGIARKMIRNGVLEDEAYSNVEIKR